MWICVLECDHFTAVEHLCFLQFTFLFFFCLLTVCHLLDVWKLEERGKSRTFFINFVGCIVLPEFLVLSFLDVDEKGLSFI